MSNQNKFKFKFNVGDRVRVVYRDCSYFDEIGTVTGYNSVYYTTKITLDNGEDIEFGCADSLELYKPTTNFDRNVHKDTMLAWINGSEIERYDDSCNTWWTDAEPKFETDVQYRVKRKVKVFKYKFAKMKSSYSYGPALVLDENYEYIEKSAWFISWLTDEITVEYPED